MNYSQNKANPFPHTMCQCLRLIPNLNSKRESYEAKESAKLSLERGAWQRPKFPVKHIFEHEP